MALPLMAEEEEGDGEDVLFQAPVVVLVPADVEAVMVAAEEGDADALTRALGFFLFLPQTLFFKCFIVKLLLFFCFFLTGLFFWEKCSDRQSEE
jgi:hypothetical protein